MVSGTRRTTVVAGEGGRRPLSNLVLQLSSSKINPGYYTEKLSI